MVRVPSCSTFTPSTAVPRLTKITVPTLPFPSVSVFGPNKFSPAPPITSSYFLSGTALRKQSELRVRGGLDSQELTRQEAKRSGVKSWDKHTDTHTNHMHPLVKTNICSLIPAACPGKTTVIRVVSRRKNKPPHFLCKIFLDWLQSDHF